MGYLVDHGSTVRFLGFLPLDQDVGGSDYADEDGNTWPFYYYRRGTVSIDIDGSSRFVRSTAVPCPKADFGRAYRKYSRR